MPETGHPRQDKGLIEDDEYGQRGPGEPWFMLRDRDSRN
jgi:hypothetical protein